MKLAPRDKILKKVCFLLLVVAPTLLPRNLDTEESVTSYSHQRIMSQVGFDQRVVMIAVNMSFY